MLWQIVSSLKFDLEVSPNTFPTPDGHYIFEKDRQVFTFYNVVVSNVVES